MDKLTLLDEMDIVSLVKTLKIGQNLFKIKRKLYYATQKLYFSKVDQVPKTKVDHSLKRLIQFKIKRKTIM